MSKTTYERGETLVYPNHYPTLTFTPIFGHRGDFMWIEEVRAAWPEHDSEFIFVRSTVHDERVNALKAENDALKESLAEAEHSESMAWDRTCKADAENAKLRDVVDYLYGFAKTCGVDADDLRELGVEVQ